MVGGGAHFVRDPQKDSSAGHVSCPWRRGWNGSLIFPDAPLGGQHHGQAALCCGPLLTHRHFKSPQNEAVGVCSLLVTCGGLTVPSLPDACTTSAWPFITACKKATVLDLKPGSLALPKPLFASHLLSFGLLIWKQGRLAPSS